MKDGQEGPIKMDARAYGRGCARNGVLVTRSSALVAEAPRDQLLVRSRALHDARNPRVRVEVRHSAGTLGHRSSRGRAARTEVFDIPFHWTLRVIGPDSSGRIDTTSATWTPNDS